MNYQISLYKLFCFIWPVVFSLACSKEERANYYRPEGPVTVNIDQTNVRVGTPLKLIFTGTADSMVFYSGKIGHQYEYRNRTEIEGVIPTLSFTSSRRWGYQENTLQILVSRDFTGQDYSIETIKAATWEDITRLAVLDDNNVNTVFNDVPSGEIDLTPFISPNPVFIAFRYVGETGTTQRTWNIKNFFVHSLLPNGNVNELANISSAGWTLLSVFNPNRVWRLIDNNELRYEGGNPSQPSNESWAVSKPINLNKVSPDQGQVIKSKYQFMLRDYRFVYDEPGVYKAVLVSKSEEGETVYEFDIVVEL